MRRSIPVTSKHPGISLRKIIQFSNKISTQLILKIRFSYLEEGDLFKSRTQLRCLLNCAMFASKERNSLKLILELISCKYGLCWF